MIKGTGFYAVTTTRAETRKAWSNWGAVGAGLHTERSMASMETTGWGGAAAETKRGREL